MDYLTLVLGFLMLTQPTIKSDRCEMTLGKTSINFDLMYNDIYSLFIQPKLMDIILKPEQEQLIKAKVNSGKYTTVDEVIAEALLLLDERDKQYQMWINNTRQKVAVGLTQLDKGGGIEVQTVINKLKEKVILAKKGISSRVSAITCRLV